MEWGVGGGGFGGVGGGGGWMTASAFSHMHSALKQPHVGG